MTQTQHVNVGDIATKTRIRGRRQALAPTPLTSASRVPGSSVLSPDVVRRLQGPILVLGASGFIGANLFRMLLKCREDVYGTSSRFPAWRLEGLPRGNVLTVDVLVDSNLDNLLDEVKPRTVFNCV